MSINELVVRGSTSISLHERFTSLRKGGATAQGQSINDDVNNSLYNRNGYDEPSPGPALRGATTVPNYTPSVKMESLRRGGYFRSDVAGRPAPPPPHYERYNPERPHYQPPLRRENSNYYNFNDDSGFDGDRLNPSTYGTGYSNSYYAQNFTPRRTPAVEAALRLKRRSLKQRLGVRPAFDNTTWNRNPGGGYLRFYGRYRSKGFVRGRWNNGRWQRGRGGFRPRSRSMGRWGSTASLASDGMGKGRRPRSNSFSGRRTGWNRGGRRGRGRGGWRSSDGKPPTKEELDQQIDSYMANSKLAMDKELDTYMQEGTAFK